MARHLRDLERAARRASSPRARSATGRSPAGSPSAPAPSSSAANAAATPRASTTSCTRRSRRATAWGSFPRAPRPRATRCSSSTRSLFEPAVANAAHVHPCAIRYEHADGTLCRAMAYVGELSFVQSLGLVMRQRGVVARLRFAAPIDAAGRTRREVARGSRRSAIASLLGLPGRQCTAPRTAADPPAAPPVSARPQTQPLSSESRSGRMLQAERRPMAADDGVVAARARRACRTTASSRRCASPGSPLNLSTIAPVARRSTRSRVIALTIDAQPVDARERLAPAVGLVAVHAREQLRGSRGRAARASTSPASSRARSTLHSGSRPACTIA